MTGNQIFGIVMALIAMFTFVASSLNLDFFFNSKRGQNMVKLMGKNGARIFYMALGAFLFYLAYQIYFTVPEH
jgi:hypothetical protein